MRTRRIRTQLIFIVPAKVAYRPGFYRSLAVTIALCSFPSLFRKVYNRKVLPNMADNCSDVSAM